MKLTAHSPLILTLLGPALFFISEPFASGMPQSVQTADTSANQTTQCILQYLVSLPTQPDNRVISGQWMNSRSTSTISAAAEFDTAITSIHTQTSKWVGIIGTNYERDTGWPNQAITDLRNVNQPLINYFHQGGLVYVMVSWENPWNQTGQNDTTNTGNILDLVTPGHPANTQFRKDLDTIASGLAQLQDSGVTVMFRPLHEQNGPWFWWGTRSATIPTAPNFAAIWQYVFNYLTKTKQLHNILWVFSPSVRETGVGNPVFKTELYYYPGPDYVDIIGVDEYNDTLDIPGYPALVATGKPIGFAEFAPKKQTVTNQPFVYDYTRLINQIRTKYPALCFWLSWNHFTNATSTIYYSLSTQNNTSALLNDSWVVTRDEMNWCTLSSSTIAIRDGWNMVSVPLTVEDERKTILFPTAVSHAFAYQGGYQPRDTLQNGHGYWLKFNSVQNVQMTGLSRTADTITVAAGWNIIGSISNSVQVGSIVTNPPGIVASSFFGYDGSYTASGSIEPGKAYWVKSSQSGVLILSATSSIATSGEKKISTTK